MKKVLLVLIVLAIVPSLFFSSCKKKLDCPGLPAGVEGYFPQVSSLKFVNSSNDSLIFPVGNYVKSLPRTVTNNPWSAGGAGAGRPYCNESLQAGSANYTGTYFGAIISVFDESQRSEFSFSITESGVSSNSFYVEVNETPASLGDYRVFGDTLDLVCDIPSARFTQAKFIYGQGLVKLHDITNNCDWTRVW